MGFRTRKSIKLAPGVRLNVSKSGIGYSAGVKGYRVTKRADGRVTRTASLPGTGLSHQKTLSGSRSKAAAAPEATSPVKPGLLAPKGEKLLYKAVQAQDVAAMEAIAQEHTDFALAASAIAGVLHAGRGDTQRAGTLLRWVFRTGRDPGSDAFIVKYVSSSLSVNLVPGVAAEIGLDRDGVGLLLAELYQSVGEVPAAIDTVEQLEPTAHAAVSLAELYCLSERYSDVVELTDGVANSDDLTALLCTFRGVALREQGFTEAAREALKEALKSKARQPVIRHRAWLERARTYELEGKRGMARKDLERILAEDSTYPGLREAMEELE